LEKHASLFCPSIRWDEVNYFGTGALSSSTKSWSSSPSPSLSTLLLVTSLLSSLLLEVHWPILSSNDDYDDFMVRSPPLSNSSRVVLSTWVAAVATHLSIGIGRQPQSWVSRRFSFSSCETKTGDGCRRRTWARCKNNPTQKPSEMMMSHARRVKKKSSDLEKLLKVPKKIGDWFDNFFKPKWSRLNIVPK
jgi:hypothetical protein